MVDPISPDRLMPDRAALRPSGARANRSKAGGGSDFAAELRRQLEQVSRMQAEADEGVQKPADRAERQHHRGVDGGPQGRGGVQPADGDSQQAGGRLQRAEAAQGLDSMRP